MKKIFKLLISVCIAVAVIFVTVLAVRCIKPHMTGIDNRPPELYISIYDIEGKGYFYENYNKKHDKPALLLNCTYILDINAYPGHYMLSFKQLKINYDKNAVELNLITQIAAEPNEEIFFKELKYTLRGLKTGSTIIEISHSELSYRIEVDFT